MAKAEAETTVVLRLDCAEARYLHAMLQNYLRQEPEPPIEQSMRTSIWDALNKALRGG